MSVGMDALCFVRFSFKILQINSIAVLFSINQSINQSIPLSVSEEHLLKSPGDRLLSVMGNINLKTVLFTLV